MQTLPAGQAKMFVTKLVKEEFVEQLESGEKTLEDLAVSVSADVAIRRRVTSLAWSGAIRLISFVFLLCVLCDHTCTRTQVQIMRLRWWLVTCTTVCQLLWSNWLTAVRLMVWMFDRTWTLTPTSWPWRSSTSMFYRAIPRSARTSYILNRVRWESSLMERYEYRILRVNLVTCDTQVWEDLSSSSTCTMSKDNVHVIVKFVTSTTLFIIEKADLLWVQLTYIRLTTVSVLSYTHIKEFNCHFIKTAVSKRSFSDHRTAERRRDVYSGGLLAVGAVYAKNVSQ